MDRRTPGFVFLSCLLAATAALTGGCGSGSNETGIFTGFDLPSSDNGTLLPAQNMTFWAYDFSTGGEYQVQAQRVGVGTHCYIYLEQGRSVSPSVVDDFIAEFDGNIYAKVTSAFGSEPNPGIDGDPKIYILLLDIRDTYDYPANPSYVAGYFFNVNEFRQSELAPDFQYHSNEKEMFYMDISPGQPESQAFLSTLAHEFQHMIHFNVEETVKVLHDNTWLNEAMSTIAPLYCSYRPDYERVYLFEERPGDSLVLWNYAEPTYDYGTVYMWAQYVKDRVVTPPGDNTIFWRILHDSQIGVASVNNALAGIGYGKDFRGLFRDFAAATYSGNSISWENHPEWTYTTINTWPGTYEIGDGLEVDLRGLFESTDRTNKSSLSGLPPWSINYYLFTPTSGSTGSVTWTRNGSDLDGTASFADNTTIVFEMLSGAPYSYTGKGYLVDVNPSDIDHSPAGDSAAFASVAAGPATARDMLVAAGRNPSVQRLVARTGKPFPVCVHPYMERLGRALKAQGIRPLR